MNRTAEGQRVWSAWTRSLVRIKNEIDSCKVFDLRIFAAEYRISFTRNEQPSAGPFLRRTSPRRTLHRTKWVAICCLLPSLTCGRSLPLLPTLSGSKDSPRRVTHERLLQFWKNPYQKLICSCRPSRRLNAIRADTTGRLVLSHGNPFSNNEKLSLPEETHRFDGTLGSQRESLV